MQPYFLPYIGYWQLMNAVDTFVVYDDIQYTKKGWINRNRYLSSGEPEYFSLPLKKDSDYLNVSERYLADNFDVTKSKMLRKIEAAYKKAPCFEEGMAIFTKCLNFEDKNLFAFIFNSILLVKEALKIESEIIRYSSLQIPADLKGQERIISICDALGDNHYINPIGGQSLYSHSEFSNQGLELFFQKVKIIKYNQFNYDFVSSLSIIDMLMFNEIEEVQRFLADMELI